MAEGVVVEGIDKGGSDAGVFDLAGALKRDGNGVAIVEVGIGTGIGLRLKAGKAFGTVSVDTT